MDKPFWEESYLNNDISTFGIEPNVTIKEFLNYYQKDWEILDVGCGEGKNDIFLAKQGFQNIDAFDISEAGIDKLKRIAKNNSGDMSSCNGVSIFDDYFTFHDFYYLQYVINTHAYDIYILTLCISSNIFTIKTAVQDNVLSNNVLWPIG